jgi:hypothetical protein
MSIFKRSKSDALTEYTSSIRFLDDTESIQLTFKKDTLGQWLFDRVCEKLNLIEKDYFGLRYVDADNQRHWLDPLKSVYKQLKGLSKMVLCFRVKFYPEDPMKLHEEITRYYLFLQLRRDLHHGRLLCPHDDSIQLAAYIIQSEVGDYDLQDHPVGYISNFKMLPKQTPKHEEKIMEAHKALIGEVPSECEANFLKRAASMDTYGVDPHQVKDQKGEPLYLGVTHLGIMTFRGSRRTTLFKWSQIRRIAYEGKMFIINHTSSEELSLAAKHQAVGFKCQTAPAAKYLWRCAVEQQLFFTLSTSSAAPKIRSGGTLFSRGSKFRFSGRCQNEAYEASGNIRRTEPPFARTSSLPNFAKKNHGHDKNNTRQHSLASQSFREEAGADTTNKNGSVEVLVTSSTEEVLEQSPKAQAPLEQVEILEERLQKSSANVVSSGSLPSWEHRENGQVVRDKPGVLETSIDESLPYEPNRTLEESSDEEQEKPCLDDQLKMLEEELIKPSAHKDFALPPQTVQSAATKKESSKSGSVVLPLAATLLLSMITFYVVFFSPIQHPYLDHVREHLHFLEPIKTLVQDTSQQLTAFFSK